MPTAIDSAWQNEAGRYVCCPSAPRLDVAPGDADSRGLSGCFPNSSPPVSGGERALEPLSVAARRFAAVLREGAREGKLGGVADAMGDAANRLLALAEEPRGELHPPVGEVRTGRFADEVVEPAHERRS